MLFRLFRNDGGASPALAEYVEVAGDGAVTGWRNVAPVVGWFAGVLGTTELEEVRAGLAAAGEAEPGLPPPGSLTESLELPGRDPLVVGGVTSDEPLGALVEVARRVLDDLGAFARAAVALEVASGATRLVHRGPDPLVLDLTTVTITAQHWHGYYQSAEAATEVLAGADRVEAGPGWSLDLPVLAVPAGGDVTTHLTVDLAIVSDGDVVPVRVQDLPAIAEP